MPYFTGNDPIGPSQDATSLEDFPSSLGASIGAAWDNALSGNPTALAYNWGRLQYLNSGERMDRASAEAAAKDAGVSLTIPDDGYTVGALDMLIQRKHDEARRNDIMNRAPTGVIPSTARFAAQLAAGISDPLNVAAGFVPVVGEARAASLFARAGEGILGRSTARGAIGAVEGGVGTAILEVPSYYAHQQLQDDYSMMDALLNVGFGAVIGGTLHVGGGAVGDYLRTGPHPYERFRGLSTDEIATTLDFEHRRAEMPAQDQARALETFTPQMRRALGEVDVEAPVHLPGEGERTLAHTPTAMDTVGGVAPEVRDAAMRQAVADLAQGLTPDVASIISLDQATRTPGALAAVRATAERQATPEAVSVADFLAARQAEQRIAEAPKTETPAAAAADEALGAAQERLQAVVKNLEQGGMGTEVAQRQLDSLKTFADAANDADKLGDAVRAAALCGLRA